MKGRVSKENARLDGVKCVVDTCHYWSKGDHCLASQIEIEPRSAGSTEETGCSTFIPK